MPVDETSNIVQLTKLQDSGVLPPTAEDAIALAFAYRHSHELRYVDEWSRWLRYDGSCWNYDTTLYARDQVRAICREIAVEGDKPASAVASNKTVSGVQQLAKSDRRLAATSAQWDAANWLLNTEEPGGDA
jgi:putative DNA primase/helicase